MVSVIDSRAPLWERTVYKAQLTESAAILSAVPVSLKAAAVNKVLYQLISSDTFLLRHDSGNCVYKISLQALNGLKKTGQGVGKR